MKIKAYILAILFLSLGALEALAQEEDWGGDGEIEDAEIVIEKDKKIELPQFGRIYNKVRTQGITTSDKLVTYQIKNLNFAPLIKSDRVRIQRLAPEPIAKLYNGQAILGYGNYGSPLVDLMYANKRSELYSFGAHFNHLSFASGPVDDENSASGSTSIDLFGKSYLEGVTLGGSLKYSNIFNHYYGYGASVIPEKDTIRQKFDRFAFNVAANSNNKENKYQFMLQSGYSTLADNFEAKENRFNLLMDNSYQVNDEIKAVLNLSYDYGQYEDDSVLLERNLLKVHPRAHFQWSGLFIKAGFNLFVGADSTNADATTSFYPTLDVSFPITEIMDLYGGISGERRFVDYDQLSNENPWVTRNLDIRNTTNKFQLYGGLRTKLSEKASARVGFKTNVYENLYFLVNSQQDSSQFDLIYDEGNTTVFEIFGDLEFAIGEKASLNAKLHYYGYDTDQLAEAWHRPTIELSINGKYNLFEKLIIKPGFDLIGGIEGFNAASNTRQELDPVTNVYLKMDYIVSEKVGLFLHLDNLLGAENQYFMNYPSREFMIRAGFSYAF